MGNTSSQPVVPDSSALEKSASPSSSSRGRSSAPGTDFAEADPSPPLATAQAQQTVAADHEAETNVQQLWSADAQGPLLLGLPTPTPDWFDQEARFSPAGQNGSLAPSPLPYPVPSQKRSLPAVNRVSLLEITREMASHQSPSEAPKSSRHARTAEEKAAKAARKKARADARARKESRRLQHALEASQSAHGEDGYDHEEGLKTSKAIPAGHDRYELDAPSTQLRDEAKNTTATHRNTSVYVDGEEETVPATANDDGASASNVIAIDDELLVADGTPSRKSQKRKRDLDESAARSELKKRKKQKDRPKQSSKPDIGPSRGNPTSGAVAYDAIMQGVASKASKKAKRKSEMLVGESSSQALASTPQMNSFEEFKRQKQPHRQKATPRRSSDRVWRSAMYPGSGPFTPKEISDVHSVVLAYCNEFGWTEEEFRYHISRDNFDRLIHLRAINERIQMEIDNRDTASINRFVKRHYNNQHRGPWMPLEDADLRVAYGQHGPKWTDIGAMLGRFPEDCRDRWLNIVGLTDRIEGPWTPEEEEEYMEAVETCLMRMREDDPQCQNMSRAELIDRINWRTVSNLMNGTRSRLQCRHKWGKMVNRANREADPEREVRRKSKGKAAEKTPSKKAQKRKERQSNGIEQYTSTSEAKKKQYKSAERVVDEDTDDGEDTAHSSNGHVSEQESDADESPQDSELYVLPESETLLDHLEDYALMDHESAVRPPQSTPSPQDEDLETLASLSQREHSRSPTQAHQSLSNLDRLAAKRRMSRSASGQRNHPPYEVMCVEILDSLVHVYDDFVGDRRIELAEFEGVLERNNPSSVYTAEEMIKVYKALRKKLRIPKCGIRLSFQQCVTYLHERYPWLTTYDQAQEMIGRGGSRGLPQRGQGRSSSRGSSYPRNRLSRSTSMSGPALTQTSAATSQTSRALIAHLSSEKGDEDLYSEWTSDGSDDTTHMSSRRRSLIRHFQNSINNAVDRRQRGRERRRSVRTLSRERRRSGDVDPAVIERIQQRALTELSEEELDDGTQSTNESLVQDHIMADDSTGRQTSVRTEASKRDSPSDASERSTPPLNKVLGASAEDNAAASETEGSDGDTAYYTATPALSRRNTNEHLPAPRKTDVLSDIESWVIESVETSPHADPIRDDSPELGSPIIRSSSVVKPGLRLIHNSTAASSVTSLNGRVADGAVLDSQQPSIRAFFPTLSQTAREEDDAVSVIDLAGSSSDQSTEEEEAEDEEEDQDGDSTTNDAVDESEEEFTPVTRPPLRHDLFVPEARAQRSPASANRSTGKPRAASTGTNTRLLPSGRPGLLVAAAAAPKQKQKHNRRVLDEDSHGFATRCAVRTWRQPAGLELSDDEIASLSTPSLRQPGDAPRAGRRAGPIKGAQGLGGRSGRFARSPAAAAVPVGAGRHAQTGRSGGAGGVGKGHGERDRARAEFGGIESESEGYEDGELTDWEMLTREYG